MATPFKAICQTVLNALRHTELFLQTGIIFTLDLRKMKASDAKRLT